MSIASDQNDDEKYSYFQMIKPNGERMATLMYYLSDVLRGGRTVFTKLGFGVEPEKGAALLWFSLFNDGSVDLRGEHSGCPLMEGLKWVNNYYLKFPMEE
ncbi:Prolyl 4-hydroxylase subunit alpha-2 [Armadillidium vulgare]|nr:Prolyl 4-hydroxylase subunit alpha-2 [Armadillidium vulgare]